MVPADTGCQGWYKSLSALWRIQNGKLDQCMHMYDETNNFSFFLLFFLFFQESIEEVSTQEELTRGRGEQVWWAADQYPHVLHRCNKADIRRLLLITKRWINMFHRIIIVVIYQQIMTVAAILNNVNAIFSTIHIFNIMNTWVCMDCFGHRKINIIISWLMNHETKIAIHNL